jgi:glycosyltransferase involved in cell wall biosynthesis
MKNIAIVIDGLTGGGAEKVMLSLGHAFFNLGHQVTLLSLSSYCDYDIPKGINVEYLFQGKASKVDRFWHLKASITKLESWFSDKAEQENDFDLVLSNLDRSNNLLAQSKIKHVYYVVHNSINEELSRQKKLGPFAYWYLYRTKKNLANKNIITVSKGIEKELEQTKLFKALSIKTIYNPFNFEDIYYKASIKNALIPKQPYIIHVGRVARQKRHDVLFKALKLVDSKYKLVLLCNNPKKATKLAVKYGVLERLILPGFQTNPYNWIKQAEVLVLSSDYEGLPTVLIESLAVGTKIVSSNCCHGPDEILTEELAPFLVPRRNPEALADALTASLACELDVKHSEILSKVEAINIAKQYLLLCRGERK